MNYILISKLNDICCLFHFPVLIVDDINYSNTNWTNKDAIATYSASCSLSINDIVKNQISVYPNPVEDLLQIRLDNITELESIKLYNLHGQFLKQYVRTEISLSEFTSGIYLLEISTEKGKVTKKIVVE